MVEELVNERYEELRTSLNSVGGPVQLFRRSCYEQIGGYIALPFGGIDTAAEIMARAHGWDVRTFLDLKYSSIVRFHPAQAVLCGRSCATEWRITRLDTIALFELVRCMYRASERPYVVGSGLLWVGYMWAWLTRSKRNLPAEVVRYLQGEQVSRLRAMCLGLRKGSLHEGTELY